MLFVIDVGNTNTVVGIFDGDRLVEHWRLISKERTADELGVYLLTLLSTTHITPGDITGAVLSSVVPPVDAAFVQGLRRYFNVECLRVTPDLDLGIRVAYGAPHEVGADRLVNAVAGVARYGAPLVIVDFGTAITVDVVSPDGAYLGGAIAPGLVTSMEALFGRTAKLPKVGLEAPGTSIGRNTMESIRAGVIFGNAGLVDRLVERIWEELGMETRVVATGGHAEAIAVHSRTFQTVDPWLTLDGLKMIYDRNRGKALDS